MYHLSHINHTLPALPVLIHDVLLHATTLTLLQGGLMARLLSKDAGKSCASVQIVGLFTP